LAAWAGKLCTQQCRARLWEQELTVSKKGDRFAVCCKHGQVPVPERSAFYREVLAG